MKLKLIYPLAVVLAAALAATGCHNHAPGKITALPGQSPGQIGNDSGGGTIQPEQGPQTGGGQTANLEEFENMTMDRAALAADTVHFAYDSAAIRKSESAKLQAVASAL